LWKESLVFVKETDMRARILGVSSFKEIFDFFFGTKLGNVILRLSDNFSRSLQAKDLSAAEGQKLAEMTCNTLASFKTTEKFASFWKNVVSEGEDLDVNAPALPRKRKAPKRIDTGLAMPEYPDTPEDHYRCIYFEAIDLIVRGLINQVTGYTRT
jgi:hypothetical protein